jgi:hypothetical protein
MRKNTLRLFGTALAVVLASAAVAQVPGLQRLKIGGGGNIDGLSTPAGTGMRFARTDAGGAYVWGGNQYPVWQQLLNEGMPATDWGANGHSLEVQEIAGSNLNAAHAYMYYGGYVFYSSNITTGIPGAAITWCRDNGNLAQQTADFSPLGGNLQATRNQGRTMAVDPVNDDHVILGTTTNGLFETFNGTTCNPTWTAIPSTSVPLSGTMGYRIAFDPNVTMTCHNGAGTCSEVAYIWTNGGGVYTTANAGNTWALTTAGGPAVVQRMKMSFASTGGVPGILWATDGSQALWRYDAGAWLKMVTPGNCCSSVAINPNNGDQVVGLSGSTKLWVSINGTAATPTWTSYTATWGSGDAPWLSTSQLTRSATSTDIDFDPVNSGMLLAAFAQGHWTSPLPTSGFTWTGQVNGIEELLLVGKAEASSPGNVTFGAEDQGSCALTALNQVYNSQNCGWLSNNSFLQYASGLSLVPGGGTMFAKVSQDFNGLFDYSGVSTDGFVNNYAPLNLWNATVVPTGFSNNGSGLVRATVPSTAGLTTWAAGTGSIICAVSGDLTYQSGLPTRCFPATVVNSTTVDLQSSVWASGVGSYDTILYVPATAFSSYNGLGTISNVTNNAGSVEITMLGQLGATGWPMCISGVTMTGTTAVNGCWISKGVSGRTFELGPTSTFATGDSYVTGGVVTMFGPAGGGIAAASTSNWVMYGAADFPKCTTNGGASYSDIDSPSGPLPIATVTGGPYTAGSTVFTVSAIGVGTGVRYIQLASGRIQAAYVTTVGMTVTMTTVAVPPGDSIATGAVVYNTTGWPPVSYYYATQIAADKVTPNTFYGVNTDYGLFKWTDCNAPVLVTTTGQNGGFLEWGFHDTLRSVPGQAGHLFYSPGTQGSGLVVGNIGLWRTCNGVNSTTNSVTMTRVPGFFGSQAVGFGKGAPNEKYPAIYVAGWYDPGGVMANSVYGIWRSIDDGSNGSVTTCTGGTWQNLTAGSPMMDGWAVIPIRDVIGDPGLYGIVYVAGAIAAWQGNFQ